MPHLTALLLAAAFGQTAPALEADLVIRGGQIVDGSGQPARRGDVAVKGERIVAVGTFAVAGHPRVLDADGMVVAPGFIDLHSHSDRAITREGTRANLNYLLQGVTSIVTGNCGGGPVDVASYLKEVDLHRAGTNVLHLIPHGSLRGQVMRDANRAATEAELAQMKQLVEQGMLDGAWGMSTGLIYVPGSFADREELVALATVVGKHRGIYASHMRNEGPQLLEAVSETLEIGRRGALPVHISHFKASGQAAWGLAAEAVRMVQEARQQGQLVTADQYPYVASSTSLSAMVIPAEYRSKAKLREALEDPERASELRQAIEKNIEGRGAGKALVVAGYAKNRAWQGKDLLTLAQQEQTSVLELVLDVESNGGASIVNFGMSEEEVRLIMRQPFVATASDGSARSADDDSQPHPRSFGCFPRKIGRYAILGKVLSLEQAIRSSSGLPADILALPRRGYVREGYYADLVVFDPQEFLDVATFEKPLQYAKGVRLLLVNGELEIEDGKPTGKLAGIAIRHGQP